MDKVRHNRQVLILDDEEHIQNLVCTLLESNGYKATACGTAIEAMECILNNRAIDLVLVNLCLPKMSGREFLKRLQELPDEKRPAAIVVTGAILNEDDRDRLCELGAVDIIQKPFRIKEFNQTIATYLEDAPKRVESDRE